MVKNLNTIERSERIRIGKYTPDEQAENSIIINASSAIIDADVSGFHVAPVRYVSNVLSNTLVYNTVTHEVVDSGENINKSLDDVLAVGNVASYTVEFQNTATSFVTYGPVGIANTNPIHTVDIGSNVFIDDTGSNVMNITGNVFVSDTLFIVGNLEVLGDTTLTTQQNLLIDDSIVELGKNNYDSAAGFDLGFVMTRSSALSNVGIGYRETQDEFFIGYTNNNAYEHYLTPNGDNNVKVHVYGSLVTDSNVGVGNTSPTHTLDVGSNVYIDDTASNILVVRGDTKIDETLYANTISISNIATIGGNLNLLSELDVLGDVHASSNLEVSKELIIGGNVHAYSNVDVSKELNVSGNVYASSNVNVSKALNVTGNTNALAQLNVTGNVYASSNVNVSKELNVSGNVYASSNVDISKELIVSGNVYALSNVDVSKQLNVTGNVYASSNVNVSKELNVTGNVYVSSNVNITKDLNVTRHIYAASNVVVSKDLAVVRDIYASNINVNKDLTVTDDIRALSNVDVSQDVNVTGNVYALSNVIVSRDIDVYGNIHALTNVDVSKDVNVTGNIYASSNIVVSHEAVVRGDLYTQGNAFITKQLTVTSNINALSNVGITKDLTVDGNVFAKSNVSVSKQLDVSGNVYMKSNAIVSKQLYVTGDIVASSSIDVTRDVNVTRDVHVTGNVSASYYNGNGSNLTHITLEQVTSYGNTTSNTIFFNNPGTAVVTVGDMGIGTDTPDYTLHVAGDIGADSNISAVRYFGSGSTLTDITLEQVTSYGNTASNTVEFTNPTTAFTTDLTSNVGVKLDQLANVVIGTTALANEDILVYDGSNWTNQHQDHTFLYAKALEVIDKGDAVYAVGTVGNNTFSIRKAQSNSSATMPALGLAYQNFTLNGVGLIVTFGRADGINTDDFQTGETVYVSNVTAGGLSNVKPYGATDLIQNIGLVVKGHPNSGIVSVTGVGRSNDIPNAVIETSNVNVNYVYVNSVNNDLRKIDPLKLPTKLQTLAEVVNTGNTVSNTINVTGLTTTGNVNVGSNISVAGLTPNYLPMVDANHYLVDSPIRKDNGNIIISADTEITGNLYITGNSISISSNSLTISDRILGIANNNPSHDLDTGIIMEHPGHNVALIHHGDEDRFSMGYTQNTVTDSHVLPDASNIFFLDVLGNVEIQNSLTVNETVYADFFDGDGGLLSNIATDFEGIIINGNVTSNTVEFRNAVSIVTTGSVGISNTSPQHDVSVGSNLYIDDTGSNIIHTTGNIYATRFIGDGSYLTGLVTTFEQIIINGNVTSNTVEFKNTDLSLVASGNVQAVRFIGDGSFLSNLATDFEEIIINGNVTSNTVEFKNTDVSLVASGNVQAVRFIGDGSFLSNLATDFEEIIINGNVTSNTVEFRNAVSIVTTGSVGIANSSPGHDLSVGSNLWIEDTGSNVLHVNGNVYATRFQGDGGLLSNIASNLEQIVLNGNVTTQTIELQNAISLITVGSVGIANSSPGHDLSVGSNLWIEDTGSNVLVVDGNILAHRITLDSIQIASVYALEYVTQTGNTTSNTIYFTNPTTGLISYGNVGVANTLAIHTLDVGSNLYVEDAGANVLYVRGNTWSDEVYTNKLGVGNTNSTHDFAVASNLYVDDDGSNVLVVNGNVSVGTTLTVGAIQITPAYNLEEVTGQGNTTSNTIQFTNSDLGIVANGGIVTHKNAYACKQYSYSNVNIPITFSNVGMTFSSNVFYAKLTAQLVHGNEEVSTLRADVQGGTRNGTESSLDIATGTVSLFGNTNTNPWSSAITTTPTMVIIEPSAIGGTTYGCDIFVEYMSSAPDGKLESISVDGNSVKSFIY